MLRLKEIKDDLPKRDWKWIRWLRKRDFQLRYRAVKWPSLRHQRLWAILPILGAMGSTWLLHEITQDASKRRVLCRQMAHALSFPPDVPLPRETFDHARYLFDKAGCDLTWIRYTGRASRGGT
jgi:hypothetical protein